MVITSRGGKTPRHRPSTFWNGYSLYLRSEEWKAFRDLYFSVHSKSCIICRSTDNVALHHLQYENYKSKRFKDFMALCKKHHDELTAEYRRGRRGDLRTFSILFVARKRRMNGQRGRQTT